ncbi:MAG: hypothetical protein E5299_02230 [Burkholderia gladioli]|nr:MAG: hypothetical protein E5299_02230 [Burkholderia gladioli]
MYRFKTLTGNCLWARHIDSQATEVSVRVGVINRMARSSLVRNPFVSPEIMPIDASHSIYATTPSLAMTTTCRSLFHAQTNSLCSLSQVLVFLINNNG